MCAFATIPSVCTAYSYKNASYPFLTSTLYIRDGSILFSNKYGATQWHGAAQHEARSVLRLLFHHQGDEDDMKHVRLLEVDRGDGKVVYEGYDYAKRFITMERQQLSNLSQFCRLEPVCSDNSVCCICVIEFSNLLECHAVQGPHLRA